MTHTYAVLDVSKATFAEVRGKLERAGYAHAFDGDRIDMHGIALQAVEEFVEPEPVDDGDVPFDLVPASAWKLAALLVSVCLVAYYMLDYVFTVIERIARGGL